MAALDPSPLWAWANERHAIYLRKGLRSGIDPDDLHIPAGHQLDPEEMDPDYLATHDAGPFTSDPILAEARFCNVFRELDRVTVWIDQNIRKPFAGHPDLWLMLAIARYINWPDTLQFLIESGYCWPSHPDFKPSDLGMALDYRKAQGGKVYTGAYMIRAESNANAEWYSWTKQQYVARIVIGRLWEDREQWRAIFEDQPEEGLTLEAVWTMFQAPRYIGWGPFMSYQAVIDMRWTPLLGSAPDINTWAAVGPGSRRGLNRLAGRDLEHPLSQAQGLEEMLSIYVDQDKYRAPWVPRIDLSDIQNCLCETDKYMRVQAGGKTRAKYIQGRGW